MDAILPVVIRIDIVYLLNLTIELSLKLEGFTLSLYKIR